MKIARLAVRVAMAALALAACSSPRTTAEVEDKLKTATLAATGSTMSTAVVIVRKQETASRWIWKATVNGKAFDCDVDTFFELPDCQPALQLGEE